MFYEIESSVIARYRKSEGFLEGETCLLPAGHLQRLVWSTFEHPETSRAAFIVSVVSVCILVLSSGVNHFLIFLCGFTP